MNSFGDQLKQERERRKVDLDEISRSTKIRVRYLRALEDGQHERLPGIVFAKGYVRAYAETIGADADRLVTAYVDEQRSLGRLQTECSQEGVLEALAAAVEQDRRSTGRGKWFAIGAVILIGAAALWFGIRPLLDRTPAATAQTAESPALNAQAIPTVIPPTKREPASETVDPTNAPAQAEQPVVDSAPPPTPTPESPIETGPQPPAQETIEPVVTRPAPTVASPVPERGEPSPLTIPDYGVGTGVSRRDLVGRDSAFDAGTQVVFWTRVLGGEPGRQLRHVWFHEGSVVGSVTLSINGAHWRTHSRRTLRSSGEWSVEAQDENGQVLAHESFVVR